MLHMLKLFSWTIFLFVQPSFSSSDIDLTVCENGLTPPPSDSLWPSIMPDRFQISAEVTTNLQTIEVSQSLIRSYQDSTHFHDKNRNVRMYDDFDNNERLVVERNSQCERRVILANEYLPFVTGDILKPSLLLGYDGRTNFNNAFFTRYIGKAIVRDGISAKKFQSCFYIDEQDLTVSATYYIADSPPHQTNPNSQFDFLQIDVSTRLYNYTYNIIRFEAIPLLTITTPTGVYCPNRTNTREAPENLPNRLSFHNEAFTLPGEASRYQIESYDRLIDERLQVERTDYSSGKIGIAAPPSTSLIDYATNISYLYTRDTQQCTSMNISRPSMPSINELLFFFGAKENTLGLQYTGIVDCGREYLKCHRWIDQRDLNVYIQQFEWYWSAKFNGIDVQQFLPIKVNMQTSYKIGAPRKTNQEITFFNYDSSPNSLVAIDNIMADCYRALGPSHQFNYAVLRFTLNNEKQFPIHRHLFSLQNRLHLQLATDLKIRHVRLNSFIIDTTRDRTGGANQNVSVTFTLLDNPPMPNQGLREPSSLELIQQLSNLINEEKLTFRDEDGAFELTTRPFSLQSLVLYLSPTSNQTYFINQTIILYENVTETSIQQRPTTVTKSTGSQIIALWMGFAFLGLIVAIGIGSFIAIRKWSPVVN